MPKYRVNLLNDPEDPQCTEGTPQTWNLPWERLVFDQRLEYKPENASEVAVYKIKRIRKTSEGLVYDVILDPGNLKGGDPKKDRPPYRD